MNRIYGFLKIGVNPVAINSKLMDLGLTHFPPPATFMDNTLNPNMNNIGAIDFCNKDWTHDTDTLVPLKS